jgi:hypothetical protein
VQLGLLNYAAVIGFKGACGAITPKPGQPAAPDDGKGTAAAMAAEVVG